MNNPDWIPDWVAALSIGDIILWLIFAGGITLLLKKLAPFAKVIKAIVQFLEDWNGAPEVRDGSGRVVESARPGIQARMSDLETHMAAVRHQVKNDHDTNLRDDVDRVMDKVDAVASKVNEHISIAKASDEKQAEMERAVKKLLGE